MQVLHRAIDRSSCHEDHSHLHLVLGEGREGLTEGETGARSAAIFAGRRRVHTWRKALAPLGMTMAQKVGVELGNGPPAMWP